MTSHSLASYIEIKNIILWTLTIHIWLTSYLNWTTLHEVMGLQHILPVMPSSALGHSKDFHRLGADPNRERSSALSVCNRAFLLRNMNTWVKGVKKPEPGQNKSHPKANRKRKDTVVCSGVLHPAATPSCQRETGRWASAPSQSAGPDCLCSARRAGRLQTPGYWWSLWRTAEKTWGEEGEWVDDYIAHRGGKSCFKCLFLANLVFILRMSL